MPALRRLEIWSNLQCAGGSRLAAIPDAIAAVETTKVAGDWELLVTLPVQSPAYSQLLERRVMRVVYVDDTFDEWRITKMEEGDATQTGLTTVVTCAGLTVDLANALAFRIEADGSTHPDFEALQLTPIQHINNFVLPALTSAGQSWWSSGNVDPTLPLDMVYSWDTALSILKRLATAAQTPLNNQVEVAVRRNGTTGYFIDLVNQIGASAPSVDIRFGKNIKAIKRLRDTVGLATRCYPRGTTLSGSSLHATMAGAKWKVTGIAGTVITLADPVNSSNPGPVAYDTQLNGFYLRTVGGVLTLISASSLSAQTVTVASAAGISVNDLIEFRLDAGGDDLVYLESPIQKSTYGLVPIVSDRPDLPGTKNSVVNPAMRIWTTGAGNAPDNWTKLGTPTLLQTTTAAFWRVGTQSCKVTSAADGDGLETQYVNVSPSLPKPYFSGFVSFFMTAGGQVRVELWATDGTLTYVFPDGTSGKAFSTQQNAWIDLGVAGIDLNKLNITQAKMRIVQDGSAGCVFYVDSAQIVNEASQLPFFEGWGPTALWQAANYYLQQHDSPIITATVDIVDLTREDPASWPYDNLTLGGPVTLNDSLLNLSINTRVVELKRNLLVNADSGVTLSNRPEDLTDALVRPRLAPRFDRPVQASVIPRVDAYFATQPDTPTQLQVRLVGSPAGAAVSFLIQDSSTAPPRIGGAGFISYSGTFLVDLSALSTDQTLYAFAQQGNLFSNLASWRLAAKGNPTVTLALNENPGGTLNINWTADVTTAYVIIYRGKNLGGSHYPTLDNTSTGVLDQTKFYCRLAVQPDGGGWDSAGNPLAGGLAAPAEAGYVNTDSVYVIAVPVDRWGNVGARALANITMSGAATPGIASTDNTAVTHSGLNCPGSDFDTVGYGCTSNAQTINNDTILVEVSVNGAAYATVTTFTLTGASQHVSGNYSTGKVNCPGPPRATNTYQFRYTLKRAGVQKDQKIGNKLSILEHTDCPSC